MTNEQMGAALAVIYDFITRTTTFKLISMNDTFPFVAVIVLFRDNVHYEK